LTEQVKNSTREQSRTSHAIGQSMEKISDLLQQVKTACDQQNGESNHIAQAMSEIKGSTSENVSSSASLNSAVEKLSGEIAILQEEMATFKLESAD